MPSRMTLPRPLLLALLTVLVAAPAVLAAASALSKPAKKPAAPRTLRYACARADSGIPLVLRASGSPSACARAGGVPVDFARDRMVTVCRREAGTRSGLVRLLGNAERCRSASARHDRAHSLPRPGVTRFCASRGVRTLRWVSAFARCSRNESRMVLIPVGGISRPAIRARPDAASTLEDQPVLISVRGNDSRALALRPLAVTRLGGSRGRAQITTDGDVEYDPRGRFNALRPGETADDSFTYRVGDGVHWAESSVTVHVAGVEDAPVAADDDAATSESAPVELDLIKAAAPAGTAGKDTDAEDDPLTIRAIATDATTGAAHIADGGHSVEYDPAGRFESLGVGQSATDTFRYRATEPSGADSNEASVRVTITGANDRPFLSGADAGNVDVAAGPIAGPTENRVLGALSIGDVDRNPGLGGDRMSGATVRIASGLDRDHHDTLSFEAPVGISGSYDSSAGVLTVTGDASRAAYEQALRSVAFRTDLDAPASGSSAVPDRVLSVQVDDGAAQDHLSEPATRTVNVTNAEITATPALVPGFSPTITDYATRCDGSSPVQVSASSPAGTEVSIDGGAAASGSSEAAVPLGYNQSFAFTVSRGGSAATYHVRCLPAGFPAYDATVSAKPQAAWFFVTPTQKSTNSMVAAFNADGVPVWWRHADSVPYDFKLLSNGNIGWMAHWQGSPSPMFNEVQLDGSLVRSTQPVGLPADIHDYQELPDGDRYMITAPARDHMNVSAYTGKAEDSDAMVWDSEVQLLGPDGSLEWSWNTADHVDLAETGRWWNQAINGVKKTSDGRNIYDIAHMNSVEDDGDGVIVSLRHTDAVYRIDKVTGAIDWKLGGTTTPESLTILGDSVPGSSEFGGQHDARLLPDGTLTLHENGSARGRPPRALRFRIDRAARTATIVETVTDPEVTISGCCGSARKLPGGDWVMSWGQNGIVTELAPDGSRPFKLEFPDDFSYRANPVLPGVLSAADVRAGMDAQFPRP